MAENGTTVGTEVAAGLTTFMTTAYVLFVMPSVLAGAGMPFDGVLVATVASVVLGCVLMAALANYPFVLGPGIGAASYFVFTVVQGRGIPWETALGAVFISGLCFVLLTLARVREMIMEAIPGSLKLAMSAGIGLFLAFIGARNAGIIVDSPATLVALGDLRSAGPILALAGTFLIAGLLALGVRAAVLVGVLATATAGAVLGLAPWPEAVVAVPDVAAWGQVLGQLDVAAALRLGLVEIVLVFLFVDMFDTMGTMVGMAARGGLLDEHGRLPRAREAMLADALATVGGAAAGTPTVTTYAESAAAVSAGGRTGLVPVVVATAFLLSLFFSPVIRVVGEFPAATAPALIVVGALMMQVVGRIAWDDLSDAFPAFITVIAMPLTYSIATGIALGFITYPVVKLLAGKGREVHWIAWVLGGLFALRFALLNP